MRAWPPFHMHAPVKHELHLLYCAYRMFTELETTLLSFIHTLPLEAFVFIASFIEEVIAPIPSPTIMILSGSFAALNEYLLLGLITLALIGACGKTISALIVYFIADRLEDVMVAKFGRFFGVTHERIEALGARLHGGARDYALLTFLRALPVMPSSVVSVGCGLLKVPLPLYLVSTFLGTIIRDGVYLYIGYSGITVLTSLATKAATVETVIQAIVIAGVILLLGFLYLRRTRNAA